jgi:hypothetical protein
MRRVRKNTTEYYSSVHAKRLQAECAQAAAVNTKNSLQEVSTLTLNHITF